MQISFPGESAEYRAARNRLLEQEIGLRRTMEAVASARRSLPQGGIPPEDYVFHGTRPGGERTSVRLSELFASGKDSLAIYSSFSTLRAIPVRIRATSARSSRSGTCST